MASDSLGTRSSLTMGRSIWSVQRLPRTTSSALKECQSRPIPNLKVPNIEIVTPDADQGRLTAFVDVNIIDSTGADAYKGDVLVKGQRIVSVGKRLSGEQLADARIIEGKGRTLMAGMSTSPANAPELEANDPKPMPTHISPGQTLVHWTDWQPCLWKNIPCSPCVRHELFSSADIHRVWAQLQLSRDSIWSSETRSRRATYPDRDIWRTAKKWLQMTAR